MKMSSQSCQLTTFFVPIHYFSWVLCFAASCKHSIIYCNRKRETRTHIQACSITLYLLCMMMMMRIIKVILMSSPTTCITHQRTHSLNLSFVKHEERYFSFFLTTNNKPLFYGFSLDLIAAVVMPLRNKLSD